MVLHLLPDPNGLCNFTTDTATNCVPITGLAVSNSSNSSSTNSTSHCPSGSSSGSSSGSPSGSSQCPSESSQRVALGVGLGIPLGISVLGCAVLSSLLLREKARKPSTFAPAYGHGKEHFLRPELRPSEVDAAHGVSELS
jgi:hypothetical protein